MVKLWSLHFGPFPAVYPGKMVGTWARASCWREPYPRVRGLCYRGRDWGSAGCQEVVYRRLFVSLASMYLTKISIILYIYAFSDYPLFSYLCDLLYTSHYRIKTSGIREQTTIVELLIVSGYIYGVFAMIHFVRIKLESLCHPPRFVP